MKQSKSVFDSVIRKKGPEMLHYTATRNEKELIELIVQEVADINACYYSETPLMSARDPKVIERIIELEASVNIMTTTNGV